MSKLDRESKRSQLQTLLDCHLGLQKIRRKDPNLGDRNLKERRERVNKRFFRIKVILSIIWNNTEVRKRERQLVIDFELSGTILKNIGES